MRQDRTSDQSASDAGCRPDRSIAGGPSHGPFAYLFPYAIVSYLHERDHTRELRLERARGASKIAESDQADLEPTLLFTLRMAFVQTLLEKARRDFAKENLSYYDHVLDVNRDRYERGALRQEDLERRKLQRVQYESDLQTAEVNLRTAKIQLLALWDDQAPVDQFGVTGLFDFSTQITPLRQICQAALDAPAAPKAALPSLVQAKMDHRLAVSGGSTDPTFGFDAARNPPIDQYFGVSVNIPLRIFDRKQGEKLHTQLDVDRNDRLAEATRVFADADSAYAAVASALILLQPYKDRYWPQATRVRATVEFSDQRGAASLIDFLNAQADDRSGQLNYPNSVASYLDAADQLNLSVGHEVIQ